MNRSHCLNIRLSIASNRVPVPLLAEICRRAGVLCLDAWPKIASSAEDGNSSRIRTCTANLRADKPLAWIAALKSSASVIGVIPAPRPILRTAPSVIPLRQSRNRPTIGAANFEGLGDQASHSGFALPTMRAVVSKMLAAVRKTLPRTQANLPTTESAKFHGSSLLFIRVVGKEQGQGEDGGEEGHANQVGGHGLALAFAGCYELAAIKAGDAIAVSLSVDPINHGIDDVLLHRTVVNGGVAIPYPGGFLGHAQSHGLKAITKKGDVKARDLAFVGDTDCVSAHFWTPYSCRV